MMNTVQLKLHQSSNSKYVVNSNKTNKCTFYTYQQKITDMVTVSDSADAY